MGPTVMDELAKAGTVDPLALRLAHMLDQRAVAVMQAAAEGFGRSKRSPGDGRRGCGMGFARHKNSGEAVTFDANGRTSLDWNSYPILRFSDAPDSIKLS